MDSTRGSTQKLDKWDQILTPELVAGPEPLPMPVKMARPEELEPLFSHLRLNGSHRPLPHEVSTDMTAPSPIINQGYESGHGIEFIEFSKGVIYADQRLDLCKMVLGPPNVGPLLDSLEGNTFVQHFLLGNNIVGLTGARRIGEFIQKYPERMDTWYLAGNCIDARGFKVLADELVKSVATNVWFKRNPLTMKAVPNIARVIIESRYLRTLDLDVTGLSNVGVAQLFQLLVQNNPAHHKLEHIYLNGNGIAIEASVWIAEYLSHPACNLKSLFLSDNPIGDAGIDIIAAALEQNTKLERLMVSSTGLTSSGISSLLQSLQNHPTLISLDIGQSYSAKDLGSPDNFITDEAVPCIQNFINSNHNVQYLRIGRTVLSYEYVNDIFSLASRSKSLVWFKLETTEMNMNRDLNMTRKEFNRALDQTLTRNAAEIYKVATYSEFLRIFKRHLTGPEKDTRKIESVYRTRDVNLAREHRMILKKRWNENDSTLHEVMNWSHNTSDLK